MPDISMCSSETCAVAAGCYRSPKSGTKADAYDQAWMEFHSEPGKEKDCPGFWPTSVPDADIDRQIAFLATSDQPSADALSAAPIIDAWRILGALNASDASRHSFAVRGIVSGSPKFPNEDETRTSAVTAIDATRRWVCTRNTLYLLGSRHMPFESVIHVATRENWIEGWQAALELTGQHTVPAWLWWDITQIGADSVDWPRRRTISSMMGDYLYKSGRALVARAWWLLATDASDKHAALTIYESLCTSVTSYQTPTVSDAIDGWGMLSRGEGGSVDLSDCVAAARKLGEGGGQAHSETGGIDALGDVVDDLAADISLGRAIRESDAATPEREPGIVVLASVGGITETSSGKEAKREFKDLAGRRVPLSAANDIAGVSAKLRAEFPHLHDAVDVLLGDLREGETVRLRPTLLVGDPGGGKSRLARRLAETLHIGLHRHDGAAAEDNTFGGTARRWASSEHCVPLEAIRRHMIANPIVMIDEADKGATSRHNGSLPNALTPFLERETSRAYPDPFVQSDVDLSHVGYILTCNDDTALPAPLRDRLRVIRLPQPTPDHMIALTRGIVADIARENGGDSRWFADLDDGELAIVEGLWPGGSVRRLRAIVERLLAYREARPRN